MELPKFEISANHYNTYYKNTFLPYFNNLKKNKKVLNDKELKKIEMTVCSGGKYNNLLYCSLYDDFQSSSKHNILSIITENHNISEKFFIKIINILEIFRKRYIYYKFNFEWVYFLKNNKFNFTKEHLELLEKLGFTDNLDDNKETNNSCLNIEKIFEVDKKNNLYQEAKVIKLNNEKINNLINYLEKNKISINKTILQKIYFSFQRFIIDAIYPIYDESKFLDKFQDCILIFYDKLFSYLKKTNYKPQNYDIEEFINNYESICMLHEYYNDEDFGFLYKKTIDNFKNTLEYLLKDIKYINKEILQNYFNKYFFVNNSDEFYIKYYLLNIILDYVEEKTSILKIILEPTDNNEIVSNEYSEEEYSIKNNEIRYCIFNKILNKNLDEFNEELAIYAIKCKDLNLVDFMFKNNLIEINDNIFNIACKNSVYKLIIYMINLKFIPNNDNLKNCRNEKLSKILVENGVNVNDDTLRHFIKLNSNYIDLNKYGYDTKEKLQIIESICYETGNFPYNNILYDKKIDKVIQKVSELINMPNKYLVINYLNNNEIFYSNKYKKKFIINKIKEFLQIEEDDFLYEYLEKVEKNTI